MIGVAVVAQHVADRAQREQLAVNGLVELGEVGVDSLVAMIASSGSCGEAAPIADSIDVGRFRGGKLGGLVGGSCGVWL